MWRSMVLIVVTISALVFPGCIFEKEGCTEDSDYNHDDPDYSVQGAGAQPLSHDADDVYDHDCEADYTYDDDAEDY